MNYEGSHFASFLPLTIVLLGADRHIKENNGYTTYKVFLSVSFFECTFCNLPATVTLETSFLVLQFRNHGKLQST